MHNVTSPAEPATEHAIERLIREKGLTGPRITPAGIDAQIAGAAYHVFPGTTLTVCCLTLKNGFQVVGESACASPENFDAQVGQEIAYANARNKIWALEGYALKARLAEEECCKALGPVVNAAFGRDTDPYDGRN